MQPTRRWRMAGLFWLVVMAAAGEGRANGTAPQPPLLVRCAPASAKVVLPEGLCDQFIAALGKAYPARPIRPVDAQTDAQTGTEVVLVVERATARTLAARIDWGAQAGESRAIARADAPLDEAARAGFLDELIARSPAR